MRSRAVGLLCSPSGRTFTVLLVGCCIFFALHNAFGLFRSAPTFDTPGKFPRKIWQSWKVDPLRFADREIDRARTWTLKNPRHRYEVLTDDNAEDYVEQYFGPTGFNRPDIVATYRMLSKPNTRIIQADLLRYLILYADGGVWADIDVSAIKPIESFIPNSFREEDIDMVIGIETDEPGFASHPVLGAKAVSFCQWTFMTKPRLPVMMRLINGILIWLNKLADEQKLPISELELDFDTVLRGTGPSAFTEAILLEMSATLRRTVTWDTFHNLEESKLVAGVLTLSSEAFAAGTGHSRSGNHHGNRALVLHHFHASSWTKKHQRHKHPIYDEVEKCNWDPGCVKLWDANTAFFDSLPKEEQLKMIEIKQVKQVEEDTKLAGAQIPLVPAAGALPPPSLPPPPLADGKVLLPPGFGLPGLPADDKNLLLPGLDPTKLPPADANAILPLGLPPPGVDLSKLPPVDANALPPAGFLAAGLPAPGLPAPVLPGPGLPNVALPAAGLPAAGLPVPGVDLAKLSAPDVKDKLAPVGGLSGLPPAENQGSPDAKLDVLKDPLRDAQKLPAAIPEGLGPLAADSKNIPGQDADRMGLSTPIKDDPKAGALQPMGDKTAENAQKKAEVEALGSLGGKVDNVKDAKANVDIKNGPKEDKKDGDRHKLEDGDTTSPEGADKLHGDMEHQEEQKNQLGKGDKADGKKSEGSQKSEQNEEKKMGKSKDGKKDTNDKKDDNEGQHMKDKDDQA